MILAKITSKNQLTLPKQVVQRFGGAHYVEVTVGESGCIVLKPLRFHQADAVRAKLKKLGIGKNDVREAIRWARKS